MANCSYSCSEGCSDWAALQGGGGGCDDGGCASGKCSGTCVGICGGGQGDGGGGCGSCSSGCASECIEGCKGECGTGCNIGCTETAVVDLFNLLTALETAGLNKKIYQADIQHINEMIEFEAGDQRFNTPITKVTFQQKTKIEDSPTKQLQINLQKIGQDITPNITEKSKILESTGMNLLKKALLSHKTEIKSDATGK